MKSDDYMEKKRPDGAKQFMPFAALKGFEDAIARKERELSLVPKSELSVDQAEVINKRLVALENDMDVTITYYCDGEYLCVSGPVKSINRLKRQICIADAVVPFDDISLIVLE